MKTMLLISCLVLGSLLVYSQQSNNFFPPVTEFTYDVYPLDSVNQQVSSEMFFKRERFKDVANYNGKLTNFFLTKIAPTKDSLANTPYLDSLFFHFDGTDGFEYFQTRPLEDFLISLDSSGVDSNFSFLDFFRSLEAWYPVYRFSATINDEYNLLSVDTLVAGFNARFEYLGERFPDETINTIQGSFNCKKFLISWKVSVLLPPLPPIELLSTKDTVWIAEPGNEFWIAQDIIPSNYVDLSLLGIPPFWILGLSTQPPVIVSAEDEDFIPTELTLKQNYPNPFNPSTKIEFSIQDFVFVSLKIYDILGNEITTLVNSEKSGGVYEVEWNASGIPSGVYFYQLKTVPNGRRAEGFVETKKMLLLK